MEEEKKVEETKEKSLIDKIKETTEKKLEELDKQGLTQSNVDYFYKVTDIYKDIANIEYWKAKEENMMRYSGYNEGGFGGYSEGGYSEGGYGARGVPGTGRGRYGEGSYGRRGVKGTGRGRYRGEEMMDEMMYHYGNYSEGGQYGGEQETLKSLDYMMKSVVQFIGMLEEEAQSPQEIEIIKKYSKKISEM